MRAGPGSALITYYSPYGFESHLKLYGTGACSLRTVRISQPAALRGGGVLANGGRVLCEPREGGNGSIWICLSLFGEWMQVAARLPIALLGEERPVPLVKSQRTDRFAYPGSLRPGDILGTGDIVLSPPSSPLFGYVSIHLTGGRDGHWIEVPGRIPIAFLTKEDRAPAALWEKATLWARENRAKTARPAA